MNNSKTCDSQDFSKVNEGTTLESSSQGSSNYEKGSRESDCANKDFSEDKNGAHEGTTSSENSAPENNITIGEGKQIARVPPADDNDEKKTTDKTKNQNAIMNNKVRSRSNDKIEKPFPPPHIVSSLVCLRGILERRVKDESATFCTVSIVGKWSQYGIQALEGDTDTKKDKCFDFTYEHKCAIEGDFPPSGYFSGIFKMKNENTAITEEHKENAVYLKFIKNNCDYFNLEGQGFNRFGNFTISGMLKENTVTMFKHFAMVPSKLDAREKDTGCEKKSSFNKKKKSFSAASGENASEINGAMPLRGLPGWKIQAIQRPNRRFDKFYYSPKTKKKFRSTVEVNRFLDALKEVDNEDEDAAWELFMNGFGLGNKYPRGINTPTGVIMPIFTSNGGRREYSETLESNDTIKKFSDTKMQLIRSNTRGKRKVKNIDTVNLYYQNEPQVSVMESEDSSTVDSISSEKEEVPSSPAQIIRQIVKAFDRYQEKAAELPIHPFFYDPFEDTAKNAGFPAVPVTKAQSKTPFVRALTSKQTAVRITGPTVDRDVTYLNDKSVPLIAEGKEPELSNFTQEIVKKAKEEFPFNPEMFKRRRKMDQIEKIVNPKLIETPEQMEKEKKLARPNQKKNAEQKLVVKSAKNWKLRSMERKLRSMEKIKKIVSPKITETPKQIKKEKIQSVGISATKRKSVQNLAGIDLPSDWKMKKNIRKSGTTKGTVDIYWFSPMGKKFRSRVEVQRFRTALLETKGNEDEAWKIIHR